MKYMFWGKLESGLKEENNACFYYCSFRGNPCVCGHIFFDQIKTFTVHLTDISVA